MNQWVGDAESQNQYFRHELVQLARLGANGDIERLKIQALRLIRALRLQGDELADLIQEVVFPLDKQAVRSPTRSVSKLPETVELPPADPDSRLELVRIEDPPVLQHELVRGPALDRQISQLIGERRGQKRLSDAGLTAPKSVLFCGPPGVGKTETCRHIARELGVPLLVLDLAVVISSLLGKSGNNLKSVFSYARRVPCILLLDEIDAIAKRRDDSADVGELKRLVTVLLQEIDLWPNRNLLVAATNHAHLLDPAVSRRFDQTVNFPRPDSGQLSALAIHLTASHAKFPKSWAFILADLLANTAYSDFVRDLNQLRRAFVLGGQREAVGVLKDIAAGRVDSLGRDERKRVAVALVKDAKVPQREASRLLKLARDTLKNALQGGADGRPSEVSAGAG